MLVAFANCLGIRDREGFFEKFQSVEQNSAASLRAFIVEQINQNKISTENGTFWFILCMQALYLVDSCLLKMIRCKISLFEKLEIKSIDSTDFN